MNKYEIKKFCEKDIAQYRIELEEKLHGIIRLFFYMVASLVVESIILIFSENKISFIFVFVLTLLLFLYDSRRYKSIERGYIENLTKPLIKKIDMRLSFDEYRGVSIKDYLDSNIFYKNFDKYNSSYLVKGYLKETLCEFGPIETKRYNSDGGYNLIFSGLLIKCKLKRDLNLRMVIYPNRTGKLSSIFIPLNEIDNKMRVFGLTKLESVDLELKKYFTIYTDNQNSASEFLISCIKKPLLEIDKKLLPKIAISFRRDILYVAKAGESIFEPTIHIDGDRSFNCEDIETDIDILSLSLEIAEQC